MASYIIIGGDGKEYGPITEADIRQWIAEGRLNEKSLAKAESDAEFRPLAAFPEFADVFAPPGGAPAADAAPPLMNAASADARNVALARVKSSATGLLVTGILNVLFSIISIASLAFMPKLVKELEPQLSQLHDPHLQEMLQKSLQTSSGVLGLASNLFGLLLSLLILWGALKMKSLRSYEFSMTAAILAMLPCFTPCCLIGLPLGLWALMVLMKPEVKSQFH